MFGSLAIELGLVVARRRGRRRRHNRASRWAALPAVIGSAGTKIAQHFIGLIDTLRSLASVVLFLWCGVGITIRVIACDLLAIGAFDLVSRCVPLNAKQFVVVEVFEILQPVTP